MLNKSSIQLLSVAYFFAAPGLSFSLLTSRMPALSQRLGIDPAIVGLILFCLGCSSLCAMTLTPKLTAKYSSKHLITIAALLCPLFVILCGLSPNIYVFFVCVAALGLSLGFVDVTMNVQGVLLEKAENKSRLSFLHAVFALAAAAASFASGLLTSSGADPYLNFLILGVPYACFIPLASKRLFDDKESDEEKTERTKSVKSVPLFIIFCGVFCLLASETEGVVVDWGSLYMASLDGVSQAIAALTFGFFSLATAGCRLFCDRLRDNYGDKTIAAAGGVLSSLGGLLVVLTPSFPLLTLIGFALLGAGLSPIVPILFSAGGKVPGVSPAIASSTIALFNYGGMLFVPPLFGYIVQHTSLAMPFICSIFSCLVIAVGCGVLLNKRPH
ncbi:MFS transporter [Turicimonas muris]|uniref:MFS transporter n=3 Tax=Turicimonas muris TaxID=1796652 RepID=UPI00248B758C|nr:MFS transporter [Turicimonas muris]